MSRSHVSTTQRAMKPQRHAISIDQCHTLPDDASAPHQLIISLDDTLVPQNSNSRYPVATTYQKIADQLSRVFRHHLIKPGELLKMMTGPAHNPTTHKKAIYKQDDPQNDKDLS